MVNQNKENQTEMVCNCKDEYRTTLCPIHDVAITEEVQGYNNKQEIILSDDNIISKEAQMWVGHCFMCTECGGHIMHNMLRCPGCGVRVVIRSKIVTDHIKNLSQKRKKG